MSSPHANKDVLLHRVLQTEDDSIAEFLTSIHRKPATCPLLGTDIFGPQILTVCKYLEDYDIVVRENIGNVDENLMWLFIAAAPLDDEGLVTLTYDFEACPNPNNRKIVQGLILTKYLESRILNHLNWTDVYPASFLFNAHIRAHSFFDVKSVMSVLEQAIVGQLPFGGTWDLIPAQRKGVSIPSWTSISPRNKKRYLTIGYNGIPVQILTRKIHMANVTFDRLDLYSFSTETKLVLRSGFYIRKSEPEVPFCAFSYDARRKSAVVFQPKIGRAHV